MTSLAPIEPAGVTAVMEVLLTTLTPVASTPPIFTVAPVIKPAPVMVTDVPPATGPKLGAIVPTVTVPATTSKALLVAAVRPELVALKVYLVPTLLILRLLKVATPFTAETVRVPDNVPLPGFAPNAIAMEAVEVVTVKPPASSTVTVTAGVIAAPAAVLPGWTVKANLVAGPNKLKAALVAPIRPELAALSV